MPCVAPTGPEKGRRARNDPGRSLKFLGVRWALDYHAHRTRHVTILCHTTIYFYSIAMAWCGRGRSEHGTVVYKFGFQKSLVFSGLRALLSFVWTGLDNRLACLRIVVVVPVRGRVQREVGPQMFPAKRGPPRQR
jgi:hypothetical protein